MEVESTTVADVTQVADAAVSEAHSDGVETGLAVADAVIADAEERVENAERAAQAIADAAMQTALGQMIEVQNTRIDDLWQNLNRAQSDLTALQERMASAEQVTTAAAILALLSSSTPQPLTQAPETVVEAAETITETVLPEQVSDAVVAPQAPEPEKPKRKTFF